MEGTTVRLVLADFLFLIAYAVIPVLAWFVGRSLTKVAVYLAFGLGIAGNLVQTTISWGVNWNVRGLQALALAVCLLVLVTSWFAGAVGARSMRRQVVFIWAPAFVSGAFLILMRLLAPDTPGSLSAVGYLINHGLAEDNAKWLNLTAQLADGRDIAFNGYAGGPLLLVMAMMAAFISVLSAIMLGGVNQVAVSANTLLAVQFMLIAVIPFAFAPFAERRWGKKFVTAPAVWTAIFVAFLASAVITSYGHLSLQFVLLILILWGTTFVMNMPVHLKVLTTLTVATTASVWLPLNVLAMLVIVGALVYAVRAKNLLAGALAVVTTFVSWDAVFSSALYVFGIVPGGGSGLTGEAAEDSAGVALPTFGNEVMASAQLFRAPGGTEIVGPALGLLALGVFVAAAWMLIQRKGSPWLLTPVLGFGVYSIVINVGDAVVTSGAPNYGGQKIMFALTIMAVAVALPVVALLITSRFVLWVGVGGAVFLLTFDSLLPRALSSIGPRQWPAINASAPQYWSLAEVNGTGVQPLDSSPIACLFVPPVSTQPTSLPKGQDSYACSRLLVGLAGLEGKSGSLIPWLQTDWFSNRINWDQSYPALRSDTENLMNRPVIQMGEDGTFKGTSTWGSVLNRNIPLG